MSTLARNVSSSRRCALVGDGAWTEGEIPRLRCAALGMTAAAGHVFSFWVGRVPSVLTSAMRIDTGQVAGGWWEWLVTRAGVGLLGSGGAPAPVMGMPSVIAMQATHALPALLAVQAKLAGMASLGCLVADGCVVRHGPPKDSGPAHHERSGADDWLGGLGERGSWVRPERCLPLGPG